MPLAAPHALTADALPMFWRETGSGKPVILLMGLETDHRGWARLVPRLKQRFRCISLDNRDVGQSGRASAPYDIGAMADDTLAVVDQLGLGTFSVIGQSMGGAIAQELARRHPARIDRLVLVSSFAALDARARHTLSAWKIARKALSLRDYYALVFPWVYTAGEFGTAGFIDAILARAAANPAPQPHDAFCRQVDAALAFDARPWLRELSVRTLVVNGEEDVVTSNANATELVTAIGGSKLLLVPKAGHGLAMTSAIDAVSADISGFLEQMR